MVYAKVIKCSRGKDYWMPLLDELESIGIETTDKAEDLDLSVVLCGVHENPIVFKGKKVLAFDAENEWLHPVPYPYGWDLYYHVLKEYYDDFINLTGLSIKERSLKIKEYINEANQS